MIVLAVELYHSRFKVVANAGENVLEIGQDFPSKHASPVLRYEDQVDMHGENTMPAMTNVVAFLHRPSILFLMHRVQAYKFELMPNGEQERKMRKFAGSCRFVYNRALALQKTNYEAGNKFVGYVGMANLLPEWKRRIARLRDSPSQTLQHALKNLDRAYVNFFEKRADYPKFKKRGFGDSFRFPQGFKLDQTNDRIYLPKLGWIRYRNSRDVLGIVRNVTVSGRNGKWYASIQTQREVEVPVAHGDAVGIDVGIVRFAMLSDGTVCTNRSTVSSKPLAN